MRRAALILAVAFVAASACTAGGGSRGFVPPPEGRLGPPQRYVAIGASETLGFGADDPIREAWTQVLFQTAFPRNWTFVNLGIAGATMADALRREVPQGAGLNPTVVTVWLNVNDLLHQVPSATYEADLTDLLRLLRAGGATKVFVANTPPLDRLPAYLACAPFAPAADAIAPANGQVPSSVTLTKGCDTSRPLPAAAVLAAVAAYNGAIARAAAATGSIVVDLHAAGLDARRTGEEPSLISGDGFHPSDEGHRFVAATFARALRQAGIVPSAT